eukprot:gnl/MRDRNA2_/MRDRNA2_44219_c0_seq1.p1 gnl/MRDRNA2_/MRDRNA2_44219_c0~~gnl/MRDRNA2_/MRDRNA2_44219_c0_seq1.p1  ORF type:complete len:245 (+),score=33.34 gnl/MRDRNA2_/MRDRNA2_44219_c0_seq1:86-736(+)
MYDKRFQLLVHRPDRRGCVTPIDAVRKSGSPALEDVVLKLVDFFQLDLHRVWVNMYRAATSDCAQFHHDNFRGRSGGAHISLAVGASFGAPRTLCWRLKNGTEWRVPQENGDVFAFGAQANSAAQHCIEPDATGGDRISVILWGCGDLMVADAHVDSSASPNAIVNQQNQLRRHDARWRQRTLEHSEQHCNGYHKLQSNNRRWRRRHADEDRQSLT